VEEVEEEDLRDEVEVEDDERGVEVELETALVLLLTDEVDDGEVLVTTLFGVEELVETLVVERIAELEELAEVVDAAVDMRLYNSSLFPAPQYSRLLPGQRKLQSDCKVALTLPAFKVLPQ
jgi:hypothetical protein